MIVWAIVVKLSMWVIVNSSVIHVQSIIHVLCCCRWAGRGEERRGEERRQKQNGTKNKNTPPPLVFTDNRGPESISPTTMDPHTQIFTIKTWTVLTVNRLTVDLVLHQQ